MTDEAEIPGLSDELRAAARENVDPIARSVARAKVARALLGRDHPVAFGRYRLLDRAGAGGMGAVWCAWDPELERQVAIKVLHPAIAVDRERFLREGQTLAKLSHPNVISIFDVGVVDDQVYLVMEWLAGPTLRAFATSGRTTAQLVDAYHQACAGLAAAHRAGIIHRDFKPDNAIVDADGRVRVLDFGLAIAAHAKEAAVAGTRRYMAPEQAAATMISDAVDQYALCVSLREAFGAIDRAPPRWIGAIIERGTAPDPAARFGSMTALARALANHPARRWWRRGIAATAIASVAIAFAAGQSWTAAPPRCTGAAGAIARSWSAGSRAAMVDHLRWLGQFGAQEAERLAAELDDYARRWIGVHTETCQANDRGELPPAQYARRIACLARAEAALAAAAEIMTAAPPEQLGGALIAARSLPSAAACADEDLARVAAPSDARIAQVTEVGRQVERARMLVVAASPRAADAVTAAAAAAAATGYAPVIARAGAAQGWAYRTRDRARAVELLERAFHTALRADDDILAVEIYARALFVASRDAGYVPDPGERALVEELGIRSAGPGRFALALLYNNLATERMIADDRAGARALLRQALATWQPPLGDRAHDLELIAILRNLALVEDSAARRIEVIRRVADETTRQLGPEHPDTINARIQLAVLTPAPALAAAAFARTCPEIPAWHGALRASCAYEEGWLAIDRGDVATAEAAMAIARYGSAGASPRPEPRIAAAYLELRSGDRARIDAAIAVLRGLAGSLAGSSGWWNRGAAADAQAIIALGETARGQRDAATAAWGAALALLADQPVLERRRARAHTELAVRLAAPRGEDARAHARAAAAWYTAAGGYDAELAVLRPIAAGRP